MNPTAHAQPLAAATALHKAPRTPVAAASSSDPPRSANAAIRGMKPPADSVTISNAARLQAASPPRAQGPDRLTPDMVTSGASRAEQLMADLKASFFTQAGEDGFNAKLDFNKDGMINAGDLGLLREKMESYAGPGNPTEAEPPPPPTLDDIRSAFFTREGDDGFNAAADLNGDGMVNAQDLGLYKQSMADSSEPTQPVPEAPQAVGVEAAGAATVSTTASLAGADPTTVNPVISEGNAAVGADLEVTLPNVTATVTEADKPALADPSSTRISLLDQLREAFFSRRGDDNFNVALDANNDGLINVGDFVSIRDSV